MWFSIYRMHRRRAREDERALGVRGRAEAKLLEVFYGADALADPVRVLSERETSAAAPGMLRAVLGAMFFPLCQRVSALWLGVFGVCASSALLDPSAAGACTYAPVDPALHVDEVPLAGPIVVDVRCTEHDYCDAGVPELRVRRDGAEVAGEVDLLRGRSELYLVFRPSAPLSDGARYSIEVSGHPDGPFQGSVRALSSIASEVPAAADVPVELSALTAPVEPWFCCSNGLACFPACFTEYERVQAGLTPSWPDIPFVLYRMRTTNEAGDEVLGPWGRHDRNIVAAFDHMADEYCATLDVLDLAIGTVSSHKACRPRVGGLNVGELRPPPDYTLDRLREDACSGPPAAEGLDTPAVLLETWCEAWRPSCTGEEPSAAQFGTCPPDFDTSCATPDAGPPDTEGDSGTEVDRPLGDKVISRGCSVRHPATRTGDARWLLAAVLFALAPVRARRRRRD